MSAVKQHQEWLSLLEVSGPFIALPVLKKIFPHGLPKVESSLKKELRLAYQEWQDAQADAKLRTSYNTAWIRHVLKEVLGYPSALLLDGAAMPGGYEVFLSEHGEKLQPDAAIVIPEGRENERRARMLLASYPSNQSLEKALPQNRSKWAASPATRMMELLRRTSVELGIVTNGEQWMMVYAPPGETTTFASWYANVWLEEEITLQAFLSLLSVGRIFGVSEDETTEALFRQSIEFQQEVSDQLGIQVRKAVELLIQALDRIDKDTGRSLLIDVSEKELYEAGVAVMMRLVFMLAAEERNLFPVNFEVYSVNYAASTLREQLQESAARHGEAVLEHRYDAWNRLLATFRLIYGGSRHEDLNSPAYGGSLFDPDKYPFLEGRSKDTKWYESEVDPLPINNRIVLHLLDSIQLLKGRGPRDEARKLSFRAIDVEQIGNVYESLLEHTAVRATEPVLGLVGSKGKEPEVPLSVLTSKKEGGDDAFVKWLCEETGKTQKTLERLIYETDKFPDSKCLMVCDNDNAVYQAVRPFVGLIREDTLDLPVIFTPGSVYVTEGFQRRSTGTHYTPRSLTEPIVEHALTPLVYRDYSEGVAASRDTLISPSEILELKVCDMTCGSGAFLVQTCRHLGEKLVESWSKCEDGLEITNLALDIYGRQMLPGESSNKPKELLPSSVDDRLVLACRLVADRCVYGVDCNPMAVEMAKLSLWLTTLQRDRPFTFVDHAIKVGDSLVGISEVKELIYFDPDPHEGKTARRLSEYTLDLVESAKRKRGKLAEITGGDICDTDEKAKLHLQAEKDLEQARSIGNLLVLLCLRHSMDLRLEQELDRVSLVISTSISKIDFPEGLCAMEQSFWTDAEKKFRFFHWALEFPEVFLRPKSGFDCIVGNPPFMGGQKISGSLSAMYRDYLVRYLANGRRGSADICAYFFLRAFGILRGGGSFGLLATNTISEGDTQDVGLEQIIANSGTIFRARKSMKWPGVANLEVALLWLTKGLWKQDRMLDDRAVDNINADLSVGTQYTGKPKRLSINSDTCFQGSIVLGDGFVLSEEEYKLIISEPRFSEVIWRILNGEELTTTVNQTGNRYVVNFQDWPLDRNADGAWNSIAEQHRTKMKRDGSVPKDYPGPVAADFGTLLLRVAEKVKPDRDRLLNGDSSSRDMGRRWWQFGRPRMNLYQKAGNLRRILATSLVAKYSMFVWQPSDCVFSHALGVVCSDRDSTFAILQSTIHEIWARQCGSTLETRMRYTPSDCFETFPFPQETEELNEIGRSYNETRQRLTKHFQEGLTKIYNRVHSKTEKHSLIQELRTSHKNMDEAVIRAYGWTDIVLDHEFRSTNRGEIYTVSEHCKQQILARLFKLNQERHAEEEAAGLPKKNKPGSKSKKVKPIEPEHRSEQIKLELRERSGIGASEKND